MQEQIKMEHQQTVLYVELTLNTSTKRKNINKMTIYENDEKVYDSENPGPYIADIDKDLAVIKKDINIKKLIKKAHKEAHLCNALKEVHDWIDWFDEELRK